MPPKNPLDIPEVVCLVASFLEPIDLASCVRVSKDWRDIFLPHQWSIIKAGSDLYDPWSDHRDRWIGPSPDNIYRHRNLIHDFWILGEPVLLQGESYPNVRILNISFDDNSFQPEKIISLDLVDMFPSLVQLTLLIVIPAPTLWKTLSLHPHIRNLQLFRVDVKDVDALIFWKACQNLEYLDLTFVALEDERIPPGMLFDRMTHLSMAGSWEDQSAQMDLIVRCPRLKCVRWNVDTYDDIVGRPLIHHPIQNEHWPSLDSMEFEYLLQDADMATILNGVGNGFGNIVQLEANGTALKDQTFKALGRHFSTLVVLDLRCCRSDISPIMRDVLCCCPRLEVLATANIFARDIAKGGPWICAQLRVLTTCIMVGELEQDLQSSVFERLSALTRLECLSVLPPPMDDVDMNVLEFRLDCGLGKLAGLDRLASLRFGEFGAAWPIDFEGIPPYYPQLEMDEVVWMVEHWKGLERIQGHLNKDKQLEAQLITELESHGIAYCPPLSMN